MAAEKSPLWVSSLSPTHSSLGTISKRHFSRNNVLSGVFFRSPPSVADRRRRCFNFSLFTRLCWASVFDTVSSQLPNIYFEFHAVKNLSVKRIVRFDLLSILPDVALVCNFVAVHRIFVTRSKYNLALFKRLTFPSFLARNQRVAWVEFTAVVLFLRHDTWTKDTRVLYLQGWRAQE